MLSMPLSLRPPYVLLGEVSVLILCLFCQLDCLSFWCGVLWVLYIYGDQTIVQGIIGKCFFPYVWFPLYFADVLFSHAEAFYFDEVPFVYSFLHIPGPRGHIGENIAVWDIWDFPAYVSSRTFMVSQFIYKSFIHLEFILVYGISWWSSSFLFCMHLSRSANSIYWRCYFLLHFVLLPFCQILIDHRDMALFLGSLF